MPASREYEEEYAAAKLVTQYKRLRCEVDAAWCKPPDELPPWLAVAYPQFRDGHYGLQELDGHSVGSLRFHSRIWDDLAITTPRDENNDAYTVCLNDDLSWKNTVPIVWVKNHAFNAVFIRTLEPTECWYFVECPLEGKKRLDTLSRSLQMAMPPRFPRLRRILSGGILYGYHRGGRIVASREVIEAILDKHFSGARVTELDLGNSAVAHEVLSRFK